MPDVSLLLPVDSTSANAKLASLNVPSMDANAYLNLSPSDQGNFMWFPSDSYGSPAMSMAAPLQFAFPFAYPTMGLGVETRQTASLWPPFSVTTPSPATPPKLFVTPGSLFGAGPTSNLLDSTHEAPLVSIGTIQGRLVEDDGANYGSAAQVEADIPSTQLLASVADILNGGGSAAFRSTMVDVLAQDPAYSRDMIRQSLEHEYMKKLRAGTLLHVVYSMVNMFIS
ncbi:hypothetical protein SeMB42_g00578 [Synchytrium endobioticum]|uniref:Uncharacterized protein n=1 Tax=Synchytrium endobioticum TaxID=286115 RepID=A0A507DQD2_9FUNG|nr:hypothetical protein SeMB42_g00578 [Synchytrium endobioticum]